MADGRAKVAIAGPSEEHIAKAARLIFDKANPDVPGFGVRDRDEWFEETRDYWVRAARELAEVLGTPMTVSCPCGWNAAGPAKETASVAHFHHCKETTPGWNAKGGRESRL